MGRCIDAEKFKEHFCEENCGNRRCRDEFDKCTFIMALEQEPTAYDPDKVVEQLEDYGNEECAYCENTPYEKCIEECIGKAIEIVKGGGVDETMYMLIRKSGRNEASRWI